VLLYIEKAFDLNNP